MANISVSVDEKLKKKMKTFEFVNWSSVAKSAFEQKVADLEFLEDFRKKSKLSREDSLRLGSEINASLAKRISGSKKSRGKK